MAIVILLYIAQIALIVPQKPAANLQEVQNYPMDHPH